MIELFDLPDEMILYIMNKVKPHVLLLCSIIGIGNNRLEQLALDKCHSIDLTFDYLHSPHKLLIKQFYSHVLPRISNDIKSLAINLKHLFHLNAVIEIYGDRIPFHLTHLKIMYGRCNHNTGTPVIISPCDVYSAHDVPLFSTDPHFFHPNDTMGDVILTFFRCSPLMRSIVSLEFDPECFLDDLRSADGLFFSQSRHLTHICISLFYFDDCVRLLHQLGPQLHSLSIGLATVSVCDDLTMSQMKSIFCPNLKQLRISIYRNIRQYEQLFSLFRHLSTVEHLTLLLAIGIDGRGGPNHFIDGFDFQRDIVSYMPHLNQFKFHIRSILQHAPHIEVDTIRQSFVRQQQPVDCVLDYFKNRFGQCQIYSLPFIGTRLDFISNRFPLFVDKNTFSNVTTLYLFDDVKPFETDFFERVTRYLPRLRSLEVFNQLEQEEKGKINTNVIEFTHVAALILYDIHVDYAEQLLCRSRLPNLTDLVICNDSLLVIIADDNQQARENCSKIENLQIVEPFINPTSDQLNFFPSFICKIHKNK